MTTLKVTYIGRDNFDRKVFLAPKGSLNSLRDIYLVNTGRDDLNPRGEDLCTVCLPKDGNPFYGEPDTPLGDQYKIIVTNNTNTK